MLTLNRPGFDYVCTLIERGSVVAQGEFTFSREDRDALFGEEGDVAAVGRVHLGQDEAIVRTNLRRYIYPVAKLVDGKVKVYKSALTALVATVRDHGDDEIADCVVQLSQKLDAKLTETPSPAIGHQAQGQTASNVVPLAQHKQGPEPAASESGESDDLIRRPLIQAGDFISFTSVGAVVKGRVDRVQTDGQVKPSASHPALTATELNPVAVVSVYEEADGGWKPGGRVIARQTKLMSKIEGLKRPRASGSVRMLRQAADRGEIVIYGDIGDADWGGISAEMIKGQLDELGDVSQLDIRISSGGGDAYEALTMYNLLLQHKAKKTVYIDGLCASAATVVACSGDKVLMAEEAWYMIHNSWTIALGSSEDMQRAADRLQQADMQLVRIYGKKTGLADAKLWDMVNAETWMTSEEAFKNKFVDQVIVGVKVAASFDRKWFKNMPAQLKTKTAELRRTVDQQHRDTRSRGLRRAEAAG